MWLRRLLGFQHIASIEIEALVREREAFSPGIGSALRVRTEVHRPECSQEGVLALSLPLLLEHEMRSLSRPKKDLLFARITKALDAWEQRLTPEPIWIDADTEQGPMVSLHLELYERQIPFLTLTSKLGEPVHLEEALVWLVEGYLSYQMGRLSGKNRPFALRAIKDQLERWEKAGLPGVTSGTYPWDWLFEWRELTE